MRNKKGVVPILANLFRPQVLIVIGLIIIIYFGFFYSASILNFGGMLPEQTKNIQWQGMDVLLTSPYFGSVTSGAIINIDGVQTYSSGLNICGDNDGKVTISNSYSANDKLTLSSSGSGRDGKGCNGNFISYSGIVPAGTLKVDYTLTATDNEDCGASSSISGLLSDSITSKGAPPRFYISGGTKTKKDSKEFIFTKPTEIKIKLIGYPEGGCNKGSSYSTTADLTFTPAEIEGIEEIVLEGDENLDSSYKAVECSSNVECISLCGSKTPTCYLNSCQCDNKVVFVKEESIITKFNNWIQSIIDSIIGIFK